MESKVAISLPTKGNIRAETVLWILRTKEAVNCEVHIINTPLPLPHARNLQINAFLKSDCTHLFTLDSDCVPQEDTLLKLLKYDLPIVVSPHASVINGERGVMALDKVRNGYKQHYPMSGLQKCDAVGGSGLLVKRNVIEAINPPWFMFEFDKNGLLSLGEDFYFSNKVIKAGFDIWVDFNLVQNHIVSIMV